jgi:hypothetical protein
MRGGKAEPKVMTVAMQQPDKHGSVAAAKHATTRRGSAMSLAFPIFLFAAQWENNFPWMG